MRESFTVPLASGKLWFVLVPCTLDRDVSHRIASSLQPCSNIKLSWCVGLFFFSPFKSYYCFHNLFLSSPIISYNPILSSVCCLKLAACRLLLGASGRPPFSTSGCAGPALLRVQFSRLCFDKIQDSRALNLMGFCCSGNQLPQGSSVSLCSPGSM